MQKVSVLHCPTTRVYKVSPKCSMSVRCPLTEKAAALHRAPLATFTPLWAHKLGLLGWHQRTEGRAGFMRSKNALGRHPEDDGRYQVPPELPVGHTPLSSWFSSNVWSPVTRPLAPRIPTHSRFPGDLSPNHQPSHFRNQAVSRQSSPLRRIRILGHTGTSALSPQIKRITILICTEQLRDHHAFRPRRVILCLRQSDLRRGKTCAQTECPSFGLHILPSIPGPRYQPSQPQAISRVFK
jgi:hypothetical protein